MLYTKRPARCVDGVCIIDWKCIGFLPAYGAALEYGRAIRDDSKRRVVNNADVPAR